MPFYMELRTYDQIVLALTKATCCTFMLELLEENTIDLDRSKYDATILDESRLVLLEWQFKELCSLKEQFGQLSCAKVPKTEL